MLAGVFPQTDEEERMSETVPDWDTHKEIWRGEPISIRGTHSALDMHAMGLEPTGGWRNDQSARESNVVKFPINLFAIPKNGPTSWTAAHLGNANSHLYCCVASIIGESTMNFITKRNKVQVLEENQWISEKCISVKYNFVYSSKYAVTTTKNKQSSVIKGTCHSIEIVNQQQEQQ